MSTRQLFNVLTLCSGTVSLVSAATLLSANPALAIFNGSFETGDFTEWATIGDTSIETEAFGSGPTDGDFQALLTTDFGSVPVSDIETFLGLTAGSLATIPNLPNVGTPTEGSAIQQTFTAHAGDILTFDWNFLTDEFTSLSEEIFNDVVLFIPEEFNDFSFVSISQMVDGLADTNSPLFIESLTDLFFEETGFQSFSYTFETSGTFSLGFGVLDEDDEIVDSGLLIDNVQLTPVPEPASILGLLALGALGTGAAFKKKTA
ncbi:MULTISPECIES: PEP-CTERM sorting domain-containing protein [unclassified Moorena]|uniref:PEP-CTERM sorting domain-containing protein n=1 Tax=unclassified Moorena TaxID=2683338 RepID=UPI0013C9CC2C|nr:MULTISPECIES: PEP-CTERM sorting domain-containing protein [unclassified Moorena]NEO18042.1 PEP-CTERM sorting domain-containing protein [Moorena sp. SIO4A5]NEQ58269.1 PEP-CTERM sorting domain-containing protein [Moorena sp. SIO4A1]